MPVTENNQVLKVMSLIGISGMYFDIA